MKYAIGLICIFCFFALYTLKTFNSSYPEYETETTPTPDSLVAAQTGAFVADLTLFADSSQKATTAEIKSLHQEYKRHNRLLAKIYKKLQKNEKPTFVAQQIQNVADTIRLKNNVGLYSRIFDLQENYKQTHRHHGDSTELYTLRR